MMLDFSSHFGEKINVNFGVDVVLVQSFIDQSIFINGNDCDHLSLPRIPQVDFDIFMLSCIIMFQSAVEHKRRFIQENHLVAVPGVKLESLNKVSPLLGS
jgi:hypothetical protein